MKNFLEFYSDLSTDIKHTTLFIALSYFCVLFSYPLVRSATSAMFYDVYTSQEYSMASFIGVVVLMVLIGINNKWQSKIGVHKMYLLTGILSVVSLLCGYIGYKLGIGWMTYVIFAIKESYIVLLVGSCLAFANALYDIIQFKRLIGPIGAAGSLGGIVGGQLTSLLAKNFGTDIVFFTALIIIILTTIVFYQTRHISVKGLEPNKSITPLNAIRGVKKYVLLIASIVALSQFVIYIADLQFNIVFEKVVVEKDARTAYLGEFYSYVNMFSIFMQFVLMPFLLVRLSIKSIFFFIPILYIILGIGGLNYGVASLTVIGIIFIGMKGTDYSLFAASKDVMYHPLLSLQKFGAKFITDMFVYRSSKALIAFVFAQFVGLQMDILTQVQFFFLCLWILVIFILFKEQKKLNH